MMKKKQLTLSMQMASIVICTSEGGFAKLLISTMSLLLRDLRLSIAPLSAGMASSKSAFASSAMTWGEDSGLGLGVGFSLGFS
jgi:hypothetical protein